jgi:MFS family permease
MEMVMDSRARRLSLVAVLASTFGLGLSYGIGYTVTSVRFESWDAAGWLVGLAAAMPSLGVLAVIPLAPRLAARLGTVRTMLAGALLVAVTFALMPVLDAPGPWLALRFLAGVGLALPWLAGETWINTVSTDAVRGRVLATYAILLFGGWAAGPQLVDLLGQTSPAVYAIGVAAMVVCAAPLILGRRLAPRFHDTGRFDVRQAVALAPVAIAAAVVGGVAEFGYISLLPSYALDAGLTESEGLRLLTVLLVGGMALQWGIGWLADRVDRRALLAALGVTLAATATLMALAIGSAAGALLAAFVLGGTVMGFYAVGLALLGERVPVERLALANAAFLMAYEGGATVGPVVGGAAMDVWRPHGVAVVMVAVALAFTAIAVRSVASWRRSTTGSASTSASGSPGRRSSSSPPRRSARTAM